MVRIGNGRRRQKIFLNPRNKMYGAMVHNPEKIGQFGEWEIVGMFKSKAQATKKLKKVC